MQVLKPQKCGFLFIYNRNSDYLSDEKTGIPVI